MRLSPRRNTRSLSHGLPLELLNPKTEWRWGCLLSKPLHSTATRACNHRSRVLSHHALDDAALNGPMHGAASSEHTTGMGSQGAQEEDHLLPKWQIRVDGEMTPDIGRSKGSAGELPALQTA